MSEASNEKRARRIIERLKMFNRKERDHLMKYALCEDPPNPEIATDLWRKIRETPGRNKPRSNQMFIGFDYHINWMHAAIATADFSDDELGQDFENQWAHPETTSPIEGNQQDMDLIVAWVDAKKQLQMVLVEAKLDSAWDPDQVQKKLDRLSMIRDDASKRDLRFINWRLLLMSPADPSKKDNFSKIMNAKKYRWALIHDKDDGGSSFWHEKLERSDSSATVKRVKKDHKKWQIVGKRTS